MTDPAPTRALRRAFREVALCLLGVAQLYDLHPAVATTAARALGDVFRAWLPGFEPPVPRRGRASLLALAEALRDHDPTDDDTTTTDQRDRR